MLTWGVVTALAIGVFAQRVAEAPLIDYDRSDPLLSLAGGEQVFVLLVISTVSTV